MEYSVSSPTIVYNNPAAFTANGSLRPTIRFVLNYKGLAYKTEWIEYPDIKPLCLKIGAKPTGKKPQGEPYYSLPVIYDPSTKTVVSDSWDIVQYLEKTYPNTPSVIPKGTLGLHAAFYHAVQKEVWTPFFQLVIFPTWRYLNEPSQIYFRTTREADFGKKLEEFAPDNEEGEKRWKEAEDVFKILGKWYDANGESNELIMGDTICYADILVAARLVWGKVTWGENSKEWEKLKTWDGGRWARFAKKFEKYEAIN